VLEQQRRFALDQEDLFYAIDQAVLENDLGERLSRARGLDAPPEAARRQAGLERAIDAVDERGERLTNGPPNRRPHEREDRIGKDPRVATDGALDGSLDRRPERLGEPVIAL